MYNSRNTNIPIVIDYTSIDGSMIAFKDILSIIPDQTEIGTITIQANKMISLNTLNQSTAQKLLDKLNTNTNTK